MTALRPARGLLRFGLQAPDTRAYTGARMHMVFRTYLAIALALMLALTGQSMAVARAASGPAGEMVLCTGTGPALVYVDENGAPTGAPHICPDCALTLLLALDAPEMAVLPMVARSVALPMPTVKATGLRSQRRAMARGPPHFV